MSGRGWGLARLQQVAKALKRDGLTLWFALRHPATPWWIKLLIVFVVGYALSPIDLIPDFIPVLGLLDDLILLPALIWLALRLLPAPVKATARAQMQQHLDEARPRVRLRWGAVLIVALWGAAAAAVWMGMLKFAG